MLKSRSIFEKYAPEVVRYFLVSSHYRSQVDYSEENLAEAGRTLTRLYHALRGLVPAKNVAETEHDQRFAEAMNDDFNTAGAIAVLHAVANEINLDRREGRDEKANQQAAVLVRLGGILGLLQQDPEAYFQADTGGELSADDIEAMINRPVTALRLPRMRLGSRTNRPLMSAKCGTVSPGSNRWSSKFSPEP